MVISSSSPRGRPEVVVVVLVLLPVVVVNSCWHGRCGVRLDIVGGGATLA